MQETVSITATVAIDIIPAEGMTAEEAAHNIFLKFQEYLTDETVFFREDFGATKEAAAAWLAADESDRDEIAQDYEMPTGGYTGPWVENVIVNRTN